MKRSILCLLVLLSLCLCIFFVSCTNEEDPGVNPPDAADVGQKGEIETQKVPGTVDLGGPNEQLPDWTTRN